MEGVKLWAVWRGISMSKLGGAGERFCDDLFYGLCHLWTQSVYKHQIHQTLNTNFEVD